MSDKEGNQQEKKSQSKAEWEVELIELLEICLGESWSRALCPNSCIVEPDGICPHNFRSILLENGFI